MTPSARTVVLVAITGAVLVLAGCDGESRPSLGAVTTTPVGAVVTASPAGTEPPAESPVSTEVPSSPGTPAISTPDGGGGDSTFPGWLIPLGAVLAVLAIAAFWFAGRRRDDRDRDTSRQRQAIALAGWIHDQLSLEVLASPPADALRRWDQERNRIDQLTIEARAFAAVDDTEMWDRLVQVLRELSTSIDVALRLRNAPTTEHDLVRESVTIANRHRAELAGWITTAVATI